MFYWAEIRDINDEHQSGRCKIRLYPNDGADQSDETKVKDEDLRWAMPLMPITSASTNKVGILPTGLKVGSRVMVVYAENDKNKQHPIIMGSFYRAYPQVSTQDVNDSTQDGLQSVDKTQFGVDTPNPAKSKKDGGNLSTSNAKVYDGDPRTEQPK